MVGDVITCHVSFPVSQYQRVSSSKPVVAEEEEEEVVFAATGSQSIATRNSDYISFFTTKQSFTNKKRAVLCFFSSN